MLLQTILQLNILILATPALAGWSLLPPVHGVTGCVAGIVWQYRAAETPALKVAAVIATQQAKRVCVLFSPPASPASAHAPAPQTIGVTFPAFPHAARAP